MHGLSQKTLEERIKIYLEETTIVPSEPCAPYFENLEKPCRLINLESRSGRMNRIKKVTEFFHGPRPGNSSPFQRPDYFVIHRCSNLNCVEPSHLYWGTVHELNRVCRVRNGQHLRFNDRQIFDILRSVYMDKISINFVAKKYKVVPDIVRKVLTGQNYKHIVHKFYRDNNLPVKDPNDAILDWWS